MSDKRWQRIEDIFHRAVELAPSDRSAFLDQACDADPSLRDEVESLLAHESEDGSTFVRPPGAGLPDFIAHYRIVAMLGEGGMGTVYRATDTKLGRDVAVKVLPAAVAADPDRMARFTREAKVLASLNHPNIAAIYGVEERALVMELVEGDTLCGPLPEEQALPIVHQLIDALEYAHEKGIIHRDLKPANIKLTPAGRIKVLDFGLAKALRPDSAAGDPTISPTMTMHTTTAGVIMGTAAYMAPEQARGNKVDARADIWAFGVVLYELLTGRVLFHGSTLSDTLASVLRQKVDFDDTPACFRRLLRGCVERDLRCRMRDIGDARLLLDEGGLDAPSTQPTQPVRKALWFATAAALLLCAVLGALLWRAGKPADRPTMRFSADLGPTAMTGDRTTVVLSPDGTRMVFPVRTAIGTQLAMRFMDQARSSVLAGTENGSDPFFSPDSQWIGFAAEGKLKKISLQSGTTATLCNVTGFRGAWWGDDGSIIATLNFFDLFRVPADGGQPRLIAKAEDKGLTTFRWPQVLTGGDKVLVTTHTNGIDYDDATIAILSLGTGELKLVHRGGYFGRYLPSGHLLYVHQGTLFAAPFDLKSLELKGPAVPLLDEVSGNTAQAGGQFDFSRNGTFAFLSGKSTQGSTALVWMDASSKKTPLFSTVGQAYAPRLSRDGKLLALDVAADIYVRDIQREVTSRLTSTGSALDPIWAPDGKHLVYSERRTGIWWIRADGSAQPQRLLDEKRAPTAVSFSPDGRHLALQQRGDGGLSEIWILPLDLSDTDHPKPGSPELFLRSAAPEIEPEFSPDGKWLAYASRESDVYQIYVRPYPESSGSGGRWQISTAAGRHPIWSHAANELFFLGPNGDIMVSAYTIQRNTFIPGKVRQWCTTQIQPLIGDHLSLDLAPEGKRFVVTPRLDMPAAQGGSPHVTFLVNFFEDLTRKVP